MSQPLLSTAERFRRAQRDWEEYRRRSLYRRSHFRFRRDLLLTPHRFLAAEAVRVAELLAPETEIRAALRGTAVWTLDTALRFATGHRFLRTGDLTGYLSLSDLRALEESGRIGSPAALPVSLDPVIERPPLLIAHCSVVPPPPSFSTTEGDRVVTLEALKSDLLGTLGWRPDLLTKLEALYPAIEVGDAG